MHRTIVRNISPGVYSPAPAGATHIALTHKRLLGHLNRQDNSGGKSTQGCWKNTEIAILEKDFLSACLKTRSRSWSSQKADSLRAEMPTWHLFGRMKEKQICSAQGCFEGDTANSKHTPQGLSVLHIRLVPSGRWIISHTLTLLSHRGCFWWFGRGNWEGTSLCVVIYFNPSHY